MRTDNTKGDEIAALVRRIEKLERQAPAGFTSITRGALRVASPEGLIVEGSEKVTGVLEVVGILTADGTLHTLRIVGDTTLLANLVIGAGGEITVQGSVPMVLGVTSNGRPGIEFAGGRMSSDGSKIALESGSATVGAAGTFASISAGSYAVVAQTDGIYLVNLPTTTEAPNLYVSPTTGELYRSTAIGV